MDTVKFYCLICSEEKIISETNNWSRKTCQQFSVIMCRYLNFNRGLFTPAVIKTMKMGYFNDTETTEAIKSNFSKQDKILCCDKCLILAKSICDIYKSWSYLQLRLNRSIRLVAEMMKRTPSANSRTITNKEATRNCQRSEFRKQFVKRVLKKKSPHDFPHLSLKQCCKIRPIINTRVKVEANINNESNSKYDDNVVKTEVHSPSSNLEDHHYSENDHEEHQDLEAGDSHDVLDADNVNDEGDDDDIPPVKTETPTPVKIVIVTTVRKDENPLDKARATTTGNCVQSTKCQTCGKVFASRRILGQHMAIHTTEKKFKCQLCGLRFKTKKYLWAHMRRKKRREAKAKMKDTSWFTVLKEPPRRGKNGKNLGIPWKCNLCGRVLLGSKKQHLTTHAGISDTGQKMFQCNVCSRTFKHCGSLYRHKKESHTPRADTNNTKLHTYKADTIAGSKEVICNICGKNFSLLSCLKRHLISHSSELVYQCEECGARFKHRETLSFHTRTKHSAEAAGVLNKRNERRRLRRRAAKLKKDDDVVDGTVENVGAFQASAESSNITS